MSNKPRKPLAAALSYTPGQSAPVVTAKGRGLIAQEIVRRAKEAGVPVHESPEIAQLLMKTQLDRPIPPQLYRAIAEILAWVYRIEQGLEAQPPQPIPPAQEQQA